MYEKFSPPPPLLMLMLKPQRWGASWGKGRLKAWQISGTVLKTCSKVPSRHKGLLWRLWITASFHTPMSVLIWDRGHALFFYTLFLTSGGVSGRIGWFERWWNQLDGWMQVKCARSSNKMIFFTPLKHI